MGLAGVDCALDGLPHHREAAQEMFRLGLVLLLAACATTTDCTTLDCIKQTAMKEAAKPYYRQCMSDLNFYPRRERERINAQYRYPLTNAASYSAYIMMGGRAPSPHEWCYRYSVMRVRQSI